MKPFWKSKTFWFNAGVGVVTLAWPLIKQYITPEEAGAFVIVGNLILRYFTTQPITLTDK